MDRPLQKQKTEKKPPREGLLGYMRFSPFGREHASGASPRKRLGLLRKALDRANVDYAPANPQAALATLPPSPAPQGVRMARPQPFESPLPRAPTIAFLT